jgi:subtilisin family serine protease
VNLMETGKQGSRSSAATTVVERVPTDPAVHAVLRMAGLVELVKVTKGRPGFTIALIDGPIAKDHPSLMEAAILTSETTTPLAEPTPEVVHATFIASMMVGRGPSVLGLCQQCTLLSLPVVDSAMLGGTTSHAAIAKRLGAAVETAVKLGSNVINLSLEFAAGLGPAFGALAEALAAASNAGVRTVVPTGNTGGLAPFQLFAAAGAIPVGLGRHDGTPHPLGTWGMGIGRRGLLAPGVGIPGAVPPGGYGVRSGSSFAAALVTATFALLSAAVPTLDSDGVWNALLNPAGSWRPLRSLVPRPLDGELSYRRLVHS